MSGAWRVCPCVLSSQTVLPEHAIRASRRLIPGHLHDCEKLLWHRPCTRCLSHAACNARPPCAAAHARSALQGKRTHAPYSSPPPGWTHHTPDGGQYASAHRPPLSPLRLGPGDAMETRSWPIIPVKVGVGREALL